jgi:hypothetical protein
MDASITFWKLWALLVFYYVLLKVISMFDILNLSTLLSAGCVLQRKVTAYEHRMERQRHNVIHSAARPRVRARTEHTQPQRYSDSTKPYPFGELNFGTWNRNLIRKSNIIQTVENIYYRPVKSFFHDKICLPHTYCQDLVNRHGI